MKRGLILLLGWIFSPVSASSIHDIKDLIHSLNKRKPLDFSDDGSQSELAKKRKPLDFSEEENEQKKLGRKL